MLRVAGDTCLVLIPVIALFNLGTVRPGSDADLFILVFGISVCTAPPPPPGNAACVAIRHRFVFNVVLRRL